MISGIQTADTRAELIGFYLDSRVQLMRILRRHTGSQELAEDALQETCLRLLKMHAAPVMLRDPQAYILRIAANIATDIARRERRLAAPLIQDPALLCAQPDTAGSPETRLIDRQRLGQLVDALLELPPRPRRALLLSRLDGLTHAEIAARLGVSENMVGRYLLQALRHCRAHLAAFEPQ